MEHAKPTFPGYNEVKRSHQGGHMHNRPLLGLLLLLLASHPANAQESSSSAGGDMDLNSTAQIVSAGSAGAFHPTAIQLQDGGSQSVTSSSQMLTAAQFVALAQVLQGAQTLTISSSGVATGGTFNLNSHNGTIQGSLVIPAGVTALRDFATSPLNITGTLSNAGTLVAFSSNPNVATASITAQSITNSGLITTIVPQNLLASIGNSSASLNLTAQSIVNSGVISSAAGLSITASSIVNGSANLSALLSAIGTVNLQATSILNSGVIASQTANTNIMTASLVNSGLLQSVCGQINIAALASADALSVTNDGGTMQALQGIIAIGNEICLQKAIPVTVSGGDILAREINIYAPGALADISMNNVEGVLNVTAGEARVQSMSPLLQLGNINLTGDPTFYNRLGDVVIKTPLHFAGAALAILASGSIYSDVGAGVIDTSTNSGNAGDITLVAGANLAAFGPTAAGNDTTSLLTVLGPNASGPGYIDLAGANPITKLSATSSNGNGGKVTLIAFGGDIRVPSNVTISTGGGGSGRGGDVLIIGGAGAGSTISTGAIDTSGGALGGNVSISGALPVIAGGGACAPCVNFKDGTLLSGSFTVAEQPGFFFDPEPKPVLNQTAIQIGAITAPGANVTVQSAAKVFTGSIITDSAAKGGSVSVYFSGASDFIIGNPTDSGVNGVISAAGGAGGSISVKNLLGFTGASIVLSDAQSISIAASNGNGGNLLVRNQGGNIVLPAGTIDASAAGKGNFSGGSISINFSDFPDGTVSLSGPTTLLANGVGGGDGGSVKVSTRSALDVSPSALSISATGGSPASQSGNGGTVDLRSFGGLNIQPLSMNVVPLGDNGNGANISLMDFGGKVFYGGSINGSGKGAGNGGNVFISESDSSLFVIGPGATTNGVAGSINVDSGILSGSGGKLTVQNQSAGGVRFEATPSITAALGSGGELQITSYGQVTFAGNSLSADASAAGTFDGGRIQVSGSAINTGGAHLHLSANGSDSGNGGSINLRADSLSIGQNANELSLSATGGSKGSASGNGGKISVSTAAGLLDIDPSSVSASPLGTNGSGAILEFGTDSVAGIRVRGDLHADANGIGDGGTVSFFLRSAPSFSVGFGATASGVYGAISALGGSVSGKGGTIAIEGYGLGLSLADGSINVSPTEGDGGTIRIISLNPWSINAQTFSADAHGTGTHNGGVISVVSLPTVLGGTLLLSANATGSGDGGKIAVAAPVVSIGNQPGNIRISARGGSPGSPAGNGGAFETCGGACIVRIDPSAFDLSPTGINGNGPTIKIGTRSSFYISGDLNASGVGTGSGGYVLLNSDSPIIIGAGSAGTLSGVNGRVIADAGKAGGAGGQVLLSTNGNTSITVENPNAISVKATNGNGGTIVFSTMFGGVTLPTGVLVVDAAGTGNFNGGSIGIFSGGINITGGGNLGMSAAATGTGKPGSIGFESTSGNISIGTTNSIDVLAGGFSLRARTGSITIANDVKLNGSLFEMWAAGPVTLGNDVQITSLTGILMVGSQVNIGNNVKLTAGAFASGIVPGNTVFSSGATADGSVWMHGSSGISVQNNFSITSIGTGGISFTGGGNVTSGNNISLKAYGGNISVATSGNINFDNGGELISIAQLNSFGINVLPNGYLIPKYTGGAIGLFAGLSGGAPDLNLLSLQRTTESKILLPAGGLPASNKLESTDGGWLQVDLPAQFQKSISNSNIMSHGGFIYLDPPGDNLSLVGMTLLAVAPVPVAPGQLGGQKLDLVTVKPSSAISTPTVLISSGSPVVPTDTVKKRDAREDDSADSEVEALVGQANVGYVTSGCQAFSLHEGDDSLIIGAQGTSFSTGSRKEESGEVTVSAGQNSRTVTLDDGKLLVSAGKAPVFVSTAMGVVTVPQSTSAVIEQNRAHSVVRLKTIGGAETTLSCPASATTHRTKLGQELIMADADCDDEELIPTDGIDRTVDAKIRRTGKVKTQTSRINLQQYFGAEPTLQCSASRLLLRLRAKTDSPPSNALTPIAAFSPVHAASANIVSLALHSADIIHACSKSVEIAQDGHIKLDEGSILVCAKKKLIVDAGDASVLLKKGAVSLITRHAGLLNAVTLSDNWKHSVEVTVAGVDGKIPVEMGQELCLSTDRQGVVDALSRGEMGRRRTKITGARGIHFACSEVSLPSILQNHQLMLHVRKTKSQVRHLDTLLKAACVLHHATGSHGQYSARNNMN